MTTTFKNYGPSQALNAASYFKSNSSALGMTALDFEVRMAAVAPLFKGVASTQTLVRATKRYIVPFNGQFYNYPMMLVEHPTSRDLFKIQAPIPNILREGLVVVDSEVYFVKLEDLRRGIVRKSRKLPIPTKRTITYKDFIDGLACTQTSDLPDDHFYSTASVSARRAASDAVARAGGTTPSIDTGETGTPQNQLASGVEGSIDLDEESRLIDLAFQEQVGTLFSDSPEEIKW